MYCVSKDNLDSVIIGLIKTSVLYELFETKNHLFEKKVSDNEFYVFKFNEYVKTDRNEEFKKTCLKYFKKENI
jgi:hypothetical protein